jgi:hypothetical protein
VEVTHGCPGSPIGTKILTADLRGVADRTTHSLPVNSAICKTISTLHVPRSCHAISLGAYGYVKFPTVIIAFLKSDKYLAETRKSCDSISIIKEDFLWFSFVIPGRNIKLTTDKEAMERIENRPLCFLPCLSILSLY